jgi:hypothetical protein
MDLATRRRVEMADPKALNESPMAPGCRRAAKPYTACMDRDTKEQLFGWASILLFGVALVVWPPLGFYIHDAVQVPLDLILSLF